MTVKELCKEYGLKYQTVYKKIAHHKNKELAGHITKTKGESLELDDYAVDFLLPFNVKVLQTVEECESIARENDELKSRLDFSEAEKEQAEKKLSEALSEIEDLKIRLSDKCRNISELTELSEQLDSECRNSRQTISELEKSIAKLTEENGSLKAQLEAVPKLFRKNQ